MQRNFIFIACIIGLALLSTIATAQNGCGATLNWTSPTCQVLGSGALSSAWTVISRHGEYSQSETECNIPSAVSVVNGKLTITASASAYTCGDFNVNGTARTAPASWPYSTGDVQWNTFSFLYGSIAFDATYPAPGTGLWPAHWMLGTNCQTSNKYTGDVATSGSTCPNFNGSGYDEIDIIECYTSSCNSNLYHNGTSQSCFIPSPNWDTSLHHWLVNWTPSAVTISRDGSQYCNWTSNIPSQPMFLITQIQTGGVGGTPNNGQLPATMTTQKVVVKDQSGNVLFSDAFATGVAPPGPPTGLTATVQ